MKAPVAQVRVPCHLPFAIAAWALFVLSFFLPTYDNALGWQCAIMWEYFWPGVGEDNIASIHYMLLTLPNVFMLASPWFILKREDSPRLCRLLKFSSAACLFLTATFFLEFAVGGGVEQLRAGYFVWVFSFGLLAASFIRGTVLNSR
jgi:hypothetical protein